MKTFRQLINESLFLTEANYGARKEINNLGNAFRAAGNKTEKSQTQKNKTTTKKDSQKVQASSIQRKESDIKFWLRKMTDSARGHYLGFCLKMFKWMPNIKSLTTKFISPDVFDAKGSKLVTEKAQRNETFHVEMTPEILNSLFDELNDKQVASFIKKVRQSFLSESNLNKDSEWLFSSNEIKGIRPITKDSIQSTTDFKTFTDGYGRKKQVENGTKNINQLILSITQDDSGFKRANKLHQWSKSRQNTYVINKGAERALKIVGHEIYIFVLGNNRAIYIINKNDYYSSDDILDNTPFLSMLIDSLATPSIIK